MVCLTLMLRVLGVDKRGSVLVPAGKSHTEASYGEPSRLQCDRIVSQCTVYACETMGG